MVRPNEHRLFYVSFVGLSTFLARVNILLTYHLSAGDILFSVSFFSEFFDKFAFVFFEEIEELGTFDLALFISWRFGIFSFSLQVLCGFVAIIFKQHFSTLTIIFLDS